MKILLVEDERRIAQAIKEGLEQETYAVDVAHTGGEGLRTADNGYDLIILDVMLPEVNGLEVCARLRQENIRVPILLLTAKDLNKDVVAGLDSGADDYLVKPFSFEVLLARIRALLRRPRESTNGVLCISDLTLDPASKRVMRAGETIKLSAKEFAILEYMMRNEGKILSKNNIISHVWNFEADILPNTVEVFMTYLRSKVDKPFSGKNLIHTVRGFGYTVGESDG